MIAQKNNKLDIYIKDIKNILKSACKEYYIPDSNRFICKPEFNIYLVNYFNNYDKHTNFNSNDMKVKKLYYTINNNIGYILFPWNIDEHDSVIYKVYQELDNKNVDTIVFNVSCVTSDAFIYHVYILHSFINKINSNVIKYENYTVDLLNGRVVYNFVDNKVKVYEFKRSIKLVFIIGENNIFRELLKNIECEIYYISSTSRHLVSNYKYKDYNITYRTQEITNKGKDIKCTFIEDAKLPKEYYPFVSE